MVITGNASVDGVTYTFKVDKPIGINGWTVTGRVGETVVFDSAARTLKDGKALADAFIKGASL